MSHSHLVSYVKLSPNCNKPRNGPIDRITIHCVVGQCTVESLGALFASPSRQASANYGIGYDGRIACYVEEENRAWTSGSRENDHRAITIEVASDTTHPYAVKPAAYAALLDLVEDICRRHNIRLKYTGDTSGNMTMHRWFQNTACPGDYLVSKYPEIEREVNRRLDGAAPTEKPQEAPEKNEEVCKVNLRVLNKGSNGEDVKALQILLKGHGCNIGGYGPAKDGVDGLFGATTESAVREFQRKQGIGVDGIVGPETWAHLLGVK